MTLTDRLAGQLPRGPVTVELDDIQATVLRYRPEPYYGTHVMLHVDDAGAGREFLRRLTPHVDSAAAWWQAGEAWISAAPVLLVHRPDRNTISTNGALSTLASCQAGRVKR